MKRDRDVHWRLAPSVVRALEALARDTGVSVSYIANYYLANCVRDKLEAPNEPK